MTNPGREMLLSHVTEAQWRTQVIMWARSYGWMVYAIHDSRKQVWGTDPGFPDLFLVRDGQALAVELKTTIGRVRADQWKWLAELNAVGGIRTAVWRPSDEKTVKEVLNVTSADHRQQVDR